MSVAYICPKFKYNSRTFHEGPPRVEGELWRLLLFGSTELTVVREPNAEEMQLYRSALQAGHYGRFFAWTFYRSAILLVC